MYSLDCSYDEKLNEGFDDLNAMDQLNNFLYDPIGKKAMEEAGDYFERTHDARESSVDFLVSMEEWVEKHMGAGKWKAISAELEEQVPLEIEKTYSKPPKNFGPKF